MDITTRMSPPDDPHVVHGRNGTWAFAPLGYPPVTLTVAGRPSQFVEGEAYVQKATHSDAYLVGLTLMHQRLRDLGIVDEQVEQIIRDTAAKAPLGINPLPQTPQLPSSPQRPQLPSSATP